MNNCVVIRHQCVTLGNPSDAEFGDPSQQNLGNPSDAEFGDPSQQNLGSSKNVNPEGHLTVRQPVGIM